MKNDPRQQPYDGALKGLFEKHATLIIPYLLPMVRLEATPLVEDEDEEAEKKAEKEEKAGAKLNVEINRSTLKADLLYRAFYNLNRIILVIELQTKDDKDLQRRLMAYHGSLHLKYNKPVVIVVIYVFEDGPEDLSYQDTCDGEVLATIHPKVIRLRDLDGKQIVREHQVPLYTLLPATKKPGVQLLKQALQEMHEYHNKQDLSEHLIWFQTILGRTTTILEEEKQIIEEVLKVQYQIDPLIRENPTVMAIVADEVAKAKAKAEIEGKIEGLREGIVAVVSNRFSAPVVSQIRQIITSSQDTEQLQNFLCQAVQASDEKEVLALLAKCFPHQDEMNPPVTEDPTIRAIVAESEAKGEIKGLREAILDAVSANFSSQVVTQVQQTIAPIQDPQLLRKFNRQLARVSDEQEVYTLLFQCFPTH